MAISKVELEEILVKNFPDSVVKLEDNFGDGEKYQVFIKSQRFDGLTRVKQHQLVMGVLKDTLATKLHAVSLKTENL